MKMPDETCKNKCRIRYESSYNTAVYYPPILDEYGNNTNPDRNISTGKVKCLTCNRQWEYKTQNGINEFSPI